LKSTNSSNEKIEILNQVKQSKWNEFFQDIVVATLSPFNNYHIKKIPEFTRYDNIYENEGSLSLKNAIKILDKFKSGEVSGNKAKDSLAKMLELVDPEHTDILINIIKKDLCCGVSTKTVNKVWDNLIPTFPVMLASTYSQKNLEKITFPAIIQQKLDGLRANIVVRESSIQVFSRAGKEIDVAKAFSSFNQLLPTVSSEFVLDGELVVVDENGDILPRRTGNGIINKKVKSDEELGRIRFVAWDIIKFESFTLKKPTNIKYSDRWEFLQFLSTLNDKIGLPETQTVEDLEQAGDFFKTMLSKGEEGAIIKNLDSLWEPKRSKNLVKMKVVNSIDMKVTGIVEGQGKCLGKLGALECSSSDGKVTVSVGSGFSDIQREEFWGMDWDIGTIIEIKGNDLIKSKSKDTYSIFLPVFVEIRNDKESADSFDKIKEIFNYKE